MPQEIASRPSIPPTTGTSPEEYLVDLASNGDDHGSKPTPAAGTIVPLVTPPGSPLRPILNAGNCTRIKDKQSEGLEKNKCTIPMRCSMDAWNAIWDSLSGRVAAEARFKDGGGTHRHWILSIPTHAQRCDQFDRKQNSEGRPRQRMWSTRSSTPMRPWPYEPEKHFPVTMETAGTVQEAEGSEPQQHKSKAPKSTREQCKAVKVKAGKKKNAHQVVLEEEEVCYRH